MEAFFVSTGVVALGEMGDKTQLLAMLLAARFRKPWPIIAGIFLATLVNHAAAGAVGGWVAQALGPDILRWAIGLGFMAMAAWMLVPDKIDANQIQKQPARWGVFGTTFVAFFLAEMGDKTQIATVAFAVRYQDLAAVIAGTTLGMMLALLGLVLYLSLNRHPSEHISSTSQTAADSVRAAIETGPQAPLLPAAAAPETVRVAPAHPAAPVVPRPAAPVPDSAVVPAAPPAAPVDSAAKP